MTCEHCGMLLPYDPIDDPAAHRVAGGTRAVRRMTTTEGEL